ncbi:hypothetical protein EIN_520460 [Entamoeba invadens IP1]|uniref:Uncharacterized protein n=1 Tax=Entamoeba invadens IP1 TaxID=370355 RepID=A0A0A1U9V1_ENTIV|nr:hypothetical protein EIN_520460 [Entamoeba invadens IP1]ELP91719.1 hypothetical protein EIN_520460 [Entamoeba invadens IP1]|eukprot:XP_004258490.1 hypothetical protein EIN_520460 [Entamoeba invadens IP1]
MPQTVYITLLGKQGVGKTSTDNRFHFGKFIEHYNPPISTSEIPNRVLKVLDHDISVEVLDVVGDDEFSFGEYDFIKKGEGFILFYAINSKKSYLQVQSKYNKILQIKDMMEEELPQKYCLVLCGNKIDLSCERTVEKGDGQDLANKLNATFFEVSAKTGERVDEMYNHIVYSVFLEKQKDFNTIKKKKKKCILM